MQYRTIIEILNGQWFRFPLYQIPVTLRGQNADRDEGRLRGGLWQAAAGCRLQEGPAGNPRGRPPGAKNLTSLLNEPVTITNNGRPRLPARTRRLSRT